MSNFTDFFPAASDGGGLSVDPLDMRRYLYLGTNSGISTKWGTSNTAAYQGITYQTFWDVYEFNGGSYANSVVDQYVNLIDVTNATNGGYLLNVIGPMVINTQYCNFKITVDGKETIIPFDRTTGVNTYAGYMRPVLGNITPGIPNINGNSNYFSGYPNMAYDFYRSGGYQVSANGFATGFYNNAYGTLSVRAMENYKMGIKFNETLKVDIQTNGPTTSILHRIGAQYQLR